MPPHGESRQIMKSVTLFVTYRKTKEFSPRPLYIKDTIYIYIYRGRGNLYQSYTHSYTIVTSKVTQINTSKIFTVTRNVKMVFTYCQVCFVGLLSTKYSAVQEILRNGYTHSYTEVTRIVTQKLHA
jgi:phosphoketolase